MNDRFKFRAWDKEREEFIYLDDLKNAADLFQYLHLIDTLKSNDVIQQCTGLKDKVGELIYEGDLINIGVKDNHMSACWDAAECGYVLKNDMNEPQGIRLLKDIACYFKIIGNIFEGKDED